MSCMGRTMEGAAAPCFPLLFTTKLHVQRVIFGCSTYAETLSAIKSCISWLAAAALLRSRRHCVIGVAPTSMPPDPPATLAHALSWKIRVTRVQHYSRGTRTHAWLDL